jgi:hypothetical protein
MNKHHAAALTLFALLIAGEAAAQIVVVTSKGHHIEPIGTVPVDLRDRVRQLTNLGAVQVGFVYEVFDLYAVRMWTSNGRYCLYFDREVWYLEPAQAAALLGIPETELHRPLKYFFPPGLVALVLLGVGGLLVQIYRKPLTRWLDQKLAEPPPAT